MSKPNTKDQILSIEEQIKRLKEKQKRILTNSQKEIGKYVMDTWEVEDVNEAKRLIDSLKDQVQSLSEASPSSEDTEHTQKKKNKFPSNPPKDQSDMTNEELQKMTDRIKALEQKKRILEYKVSNQARKDRTRRLIQKGALLEKYLEENENTSLQDTETLLKVLAHFKNQNKEYIKRQTQTLKEQNEIPNM